MKDNPIRLWHMAAAAAVGAGAVLLLSGTTSKPLTCTATDGDTIKCGRERVRILGVDAPELPGHCRPGRGCAPGDPFASKAHMAQLLAQPVTLKRHGRDGYGRTLAHAYAGGASLACSQLAGGFAIYKPAWDDKPRGQVKRECGL